MNYATLSFGLKQFLQSVRRFFASDTVFFSGLQQGLNAGYKKFYFF